MSAPLLERKRYTLASAAVCLAYASFAVGLGMTPLALLLLTTTFLTAQPGHEPELGLEEERRSSRRSSAGEGHGDDIPRDGNMGSDGYDDEQDGSATISRVSSAVDLAAMESLAELTATDGAPAVTVTAPHPDEEDDLSQSDHIVRKAGRRPELKARRSRAYPCRASRIRRPAVSQPCSQVCSNPAKSVPGHGAAVLPVKVVMRALLLHVQSASVVV
mmetsp:Transcript_3102/g.9451  ORF Transcript_3102/g.9451 Transcript_3102/m.9451 type:complete len:217 (+) Transcript_3102:2768-3418(+)